MEKKNYDKQRILQQYQKISQGKQRQTENASTTIPKALFIKPPSLVSPISSSETPQNEKKESDDEDEKMIVSESIISSLCKLHSILKKKINSLSTEQNEEEQYSEMYYNLNIIFKMIPILYNEEKSNNYLRILTNKIIDSENEEEIEEAIVRKEKMELAKKKQKEAIEKIKQQQNAFDSFLSDEMIEEDENENLEEEEDEEKIRIRKEKEEFERKSKDEFLDNEFAEMSLHANNECVFCHSAKSPKGSEQLMYFVSLCRSGIPYLGFFF